VCCVPADLLPTLPPSHPTQPHPYKPSPTSIHTLPADLKLELDNLATFLRMAAQYKDKIGFGGTLLLEPKPQEPTKHQVGCCVRVCGVLGGGGAVCAYACLRPVAPTLALPAAMGCIRFTCCACTAQILSTVLGNGTHCLPAALQYDWDAATTIGFLKTHGLDKDFKLNIECNHATLSGHSCEHELQLASINGMLGNIDANTGGLVLWCHTYQSLAAALTHARHCCPKLATHIIIAIFLLQATRRSGGTRTSSCLTPAKPPC
jgi:hypothetical protein